ncbi:MAG: single-stranded DNA-binding protein [Marmoricola sp.]|nr:single-stranded DNA-binding protein [Marmoricola sp.]
MSAPAAAEDVAPTPGPTPDTTDTPDTTSAAPAPAPHLNEVVLTGRVSATPEERELPSGDRLVTFRVIVDRPPERGSTKRAVDVIDVACWGGRVRRSALALSAGDAVRVEGSLRRRFFAAGAGRASRYEVEARRAVRSPG